MNVLIVGLGLMGGAYAYKLKNKGYTVYATDINQGAIDYAIDNEYINGGDINPEKFIKSSDVIILAIYPKLVLEFIDKYKHLFNEKQIITDICGVKSTFVYDAIKNSYPAKYVSHHPMAGREKSGVNYSNEVSFGGANYIITVTDDSDKEAVEVLRKIGADLAFSRITVIDVKTHDEMIGFTSQLTHAIAVSLVNSDHNPNTKFFIGDSYRDLTRIAKINEELWSELFLENKENLLHHIESFENELDILKKALKNENKEELKEIFKHSTLIRKEMDK